MSSNAELKRTELHDLHLELGAKMVPFAGYHMPVQFPLGVMGEHLHTRSKAGLFDVSHMGQALLVGKPGHDAARALEALVPSDICGLKGGGQRYTMFLNSSGGILDDLIVTRPESSEGNVYLVVNAACKEQDFDLLAAKLAETTELIQMDDRALLALQGPAAAGVLKPLFPEVVEMAFMTQCCATFEGVEVYISRSGYTGEDGFEISLPSGIAEEFARRLLADQAVAPIGLGARDSLRLEAGLCLYGSDLDETTSPIEAGLAFAVNKTRRERADFPGAGRILKELDEGPKRCRVGIKPDGRAPARHGAEIIGNAGAVIGLVTSGGFGPGVGGPIAMGYLERKYAEEGTSIGLMVRGKKLPAKVVRMPFVPHRYYRKAKAN
jgi:aminomethyltransferase